MNVTSDIHRFSSQFIRSNDRSAIPAVPEPTRGVPVVGETKAEFQLNSGFFYDESVCSGTIAGFKVTCIDGEASIVENQSSMSCSIDPGTPSVIMCNEDANVNNTRNHYIGVLRYVSRLCFFVCLSSGSPFRPPKSHRANTLDEMPAGLPPRR